MIPSPTYPTVLTHVRVPLMHTDTVAHAVRLITEAQAAAGQ